MSSVRDRQRAAARAKLEREMVERAEAARLKRRQRTQIGLVAGGVLLTVVLVWTIVATAGGDDPKTAASPTASAAPSTADCVWNPLVDPAATPKPSMPAGIKDVGTPATSVPAVGTQTVTLDTNLGKIAFEMDLSKTPCTSASIAHLASKKYYDGTSCHRLVTQISALQCGDPTGDGTGGPAYRFANENLPTEKRPSYTEGDVAMANADNAEQGITDTNGSQFFFIYGQNELPANYTVVGRVTAGMDIIKSVGAAGDDGAFAQMAGGGHPKKKITFKTVTVSPATAATPTS
ncbi:peptidylprolyl isomerase [Luedemannella helvata]|uniref:Peptidylprolyl isomerase n=1 Tax=Luedemannella helvata TaxID=349315 RepID=A0ABP4WDX3_9ACTN